MKHGFTPVIVQILKDQFGETGENIFHSSQLLQYLNIKTRSASSGSKSRGAFANHYALYVLIEDYVQKGFYQNQLYREYEGARFSDLLSRQRELPFGAKLQNHALNSRLNEEFKKYFPTSEYIPILRDIKTNRYWINENLLLIRIQDRIFNIAQAVLKIITFCARIDETSWSMNLM